MNKEEVVKLAQKLWDYHHMNHVVQNVDCILVFGSHDERVAIRGAELYLQGIAPKILFSGGLGRLTEDVWKETEADKFANIAKKLGVPERDMLIENTSTNSSENVRFSMDLLKDEGIHHNDIMIVHKPYMERRAFATFKKHFPDQNLIVTSQDISMIKYINDEITMDDVINLLVGDMQRIIKYPEKGFQIYQEVPNDVLEAMNLLIEHGYNDQLID